MNKFLYTGRDDPHDLAALYYGDLQPHPEGDWFEVPHTTYSDYSGGTVERSNYRSLSEAWEEIPGVKSAYGGYDTTGLLVHIDTFEANEEIQEVFEELEMYPLYSEEDHSWLESEWEEEAFDCWIKQHIESYLEDRLSEAELLLLEYDPDMDLKSLFWQTQNELNHYFTYEHDSAYLDEEDATEIASHIAGQIKEAYGDPN